MLKFVIVGPIRNPETFARGNGIRELRRLQKVHGTGRWRKRKGDATIRLESGVELEAELHWYEATGLGKKEFKIKRILS